MYSSHHQQPQYPTTPPRRGGGGSVDVSPQFVLEDEEPFTRQPQVPHQGGSSYSSAASSLGPQTPQGVSSPSLAHGGGSPRDYFGQQPGAGEHYFPKVTAPSTPYYGGPQVPPATHQVHGRPGPPPLTLQTYHIAPSPSFASPFADVPPPSPVLAWNPAQRMTAGGEDDMEKLVATPRSTMVGRDTGEERRSVFWNRFSMVAHKAESQPKNSTWLRRHDGSVSKVRVMSWIGLLVVCCLVGGLLAWHFLDPSGTKTTGNWSGLIERRAALDVASVEHLLADAATVSIDVAHSDAPRLASPAIGRLAHRAKGQLARHL